MASKLNKYTINFYELQASTDSGDSFLTIMYVVEVTFLASQQQFSSNVVSCFGQISLAANGCMVVKSQAGFSELLIVVEHSVVLLDTMTFQPHSQTFLNFSFESLAVCGQNNGVGKELGMRLIIFCFKLCILCGTVVVSMPKTATELCILCV